MRKQSTEIKDIEEIAQQAHLGKDVSEHFTGNFQVKQQINLDFPPELLRSIDVECQLQNMSRQDWIKMVCVEKLRAIQSSRIANTV
ncbi:hypothetical protein myaer102_25440 [Microcystis viridis NIES-102]|uniref:Uncharacterized protein n=1 Tax=Microcystis viridis NIES-102 TaxID=213615 RepID=A0A3G9K4B1_MICVR|nr:hypothetical protein [Microcystis viridis]BBH40000.1 hypothetical protein myaer102_25440 [Microcystis viridis NIES-102]